MVPPEANDMAKLSLMFEEKLVKEIPVGSRPVRIGRSPDNDLVVDNLAFQMTTRGFTSKQAALWSKTEAVSTALS